MPKMTAEFGYYPGRLDFTVGDIVVTTLPGIEATIADVLRSPNIEGDWIYPGRLQRRDMEDTVKELPYSSRVFGLPKTHVIEHANADSSDHLDFLIWALSFFAGMRQTITEAGFVDAASIKTGKLVDFLVSVPAYPNALNLAELFWQNNKINAMSAKRWKAAVHALFIAQWPQALQFEQFTYLYGSLDACFSLAKTFHGQTVRLNHSARIGWMCKLFNIPIPVWAAIVPGSPAEIADIRNDTIHESLFMGAPLGFALHGVGTNQNLTFEMENLICRLLVALIGKPDSDYVRSVVGTRMMHLLEF